MSLYVLDTDTLSLYEHRHPIVVGNVQAHASSDELAVTVITVEEQMSGWYSVLRRVRQRDRLAAAYQRLADLVPLLSHFAILPFPETAMDRFDQFRALKLNIGQMDLRIAAIVLEAGGTLVTRNHRNFRRVRNLPLSR
jgi:tRNA(fMet)-specific endonuclease VapC